MENPDLWSIIDTSIKVGLGALIAGLCLWINQRRLPATQERSERRIDMLEAVSRDVGNVNHIFAKYSSLAIESTRFGNRWPQARKDELTKVNSELVEEFRKMADAESKLLMLGEKALEKTLRLYGAKLPSSANRSTSVDKTSASKTSCKSNRKSCNCESSSTIF